MLDFTKKTTRAELVTEIEALRAGIKQQAEENEQQRVLLHAARVRSQNLEHKVEVLETDVHNLLGAIRVFADSARTVRIRAKSVQSADMAVALPFRNTEAL